MSIERTEQEVINRLKGQLQIAKSHIAAILDGARVYGSMPLNSETILGGVEADVVRLQDLISEIVDSEGFKSWKSQLDSKEGALATKSKKIKDLAGELRKKDSIHAEEIAAIKAAIEAEMTRLSELMDSKQVELADALQRSQEYASRIALVKEQLDSLKTKYAEKDAAAIAEKESIKTTIEEQMRAFQQKMQEDTSESIASYKDKIDIVSAQLKTVARLLAEKNARIEKMVEARNERKKELRDVRGELKEAEAAVELQKVDYQARVAALEDELRAREEREKVMQEKMKAQKERSLEKSRLLAEFKNESAKERRQTEGLSRIIINWRDSAQKLRLTREKENLDSKRRVFGKLTKAVTDSKERKEQLRESLLRFKEGVGRSRQEAENFRVTKNTLTRWMRVVSKTKAENFRVTRNALIHWKRVVSKTIKEREEYESNLAGMYKLLKEREEHELHQMQMEDELSESMRADSQVEEALEYETLKQRADSGDIEACRQIITKLEEMISESRTVGDTGTAESLQQEKAKYEAIKKINRMKELSDKYKEGPGGVTIDELKEYIAILQSSGIDTADLNTQLSKKEKNKKKRQKKKAKKIDGAGNPYDEFKYYTDYDIKSIADDEGDPRSLIALEALALKHFEESQKLLRRGLVDISQGKILESIELFQTAKERGSLKATYQLARIYSSYCKQPPEGMLDVKTAAKYMKEAAEEEGAGFMQLILYAQFLLYGKNELGEKIDSNRNVNSGASDGMRRARVAFVRKYIAENYSLGMKMYKDAMNLEAQTKEEHENKTLCRYNLVLACLGGDLGACDKKEEINFILEEMYDLTQDPLYTDPMFVMINRGGKVKSFMQKAKDAGVPEASLNRVSRLVVKRAERMEPANKQKIRARHLASATLEELSEDDGVDAIEAVMHRSFTGQKADESEVDFVRALEFAKKLLEHPEASSSVISKARYVQAVSALEIAATKVDEADKEERESLIEEALRRLENSLIVTKDPFVIYNLVMFYSDGVTYNNKKIPEAELDEEKAYEFLALTKEIPQSLLAGQEARRIYSILNIKLIRAIALDEKLHGTPGDVLAAIKQALGSLDCGILDILTSEEDKVKLSEYFSEYPDELAEFERYCRFAEQKTTELQAQPLAQAGITSFFGNVPIAGLLSESKEGSELLKRMSAASAVPVGMPVDLERIARSEAATQVFAPTNGLSGAVAQARGEI